MEFLNIFQWLCSFDGIPSATPSKHRYRTYRLFDRCDRRSLGLRGMLVSSAWAWLESGESTADNQRCLDLGGCPSTNLAAVPLSLARIRRGGGPTLKQPLSGPRRNG